MSLFRALESVVQTAKCWQFLPILLLALGMFFMVSPVSGQDFFVSPYGDDSDDGSIDNPFKTIDKAVEEAQVGDAIFLRGGLYSYSQTIRIEKSGEAENLIRLCSYQDEIPILDFHDCGDSDRGINLRGNYWHLKGFIIQYAGDNGLIVYGSHNILERLVTCYNGDSGLQLHTGASYNLIIDCDSCFNYDSQNHGENADGFAAKFSLGEGNAFVDCRAWSNSDDGYDFWEAGNGVIVEGCWAFRNGENIWSDPSFSGDGNGFKMGHGSGAHVLLWCLAYDHPHHGIDVNGNLTGVTVYNCTSVENQGRNFYFDEHSDVHILRNNISYLGMVLIYPEIDDEYNSWNGFTVGSTDFRSLNPEGIDSPREPDGGLPRLSFLRLSTASLLIDAGIDVGLAYEGEAPDLGAFEHLDGDCDGDGDVDLDDLQRLVDNWMEVDCGDCNGADFDGNCKVDLCDFARLAGNWFK